MKSQTKSLLRSSTESSQMNKSIHDTLRDRYSQDQNPVLRDLIAFSSPRHNRDPNASSLLKEQTNKRIENRSNVSEKKSSLKSGSLNSKGFLSGSKEYTKAKSTKNKENVHPEKQMQKNKSHKKTFKASLEYSSPKENQGPMIRKHKEEITRRTLQNDEEDFEENFEASQSLCRANVMNFLKTSMSDSCSMTQINDNSTKETFCYERKTEESSYPSYRNNNLIDQLDSSELHSFVNDQDKSKNKGFNMQLEYSNLPEQRLNSAPVSMGRESLYHSQSGLLHTEMLESCATDRYAEKSLKNSELIKMIQSLKCQVQAKGLKRNEAKKKAESAKSMGNKLKSKLDEVCVRYQETEGVLNKIQYQVQQQENEVESLNVCVQKLEDNVESNSKADVELKDYRMKVAMYEKLVEQKTREAVDIAQKLQKAEKKHGIPRKVNPRFLEHVHCLEEEIENQENEITNLIQKIQEVEGETDEYRKTESKLGELEELQNYMIEENDNLRQEIADEEEREQELRIEMEESNLDIQNKLANLCCKLKRLDENAKNLVVVVEAIIEDKEDQINLDSECKIDLFEDTLQNLDHLQVVKKIVSLTEGIQKKFTRSLEYVSENNTLQYQNECNPQ